MTLGAVIKAECMQAAIKKIVKGTASQRRQHHVSRARADAARVFA